MKDRTHIITTPTGMRILHELTPWAVIRPAFSLANIAMVDHRLQLANGYSQRPVERHADGTFITVTHLYAMLIGIANLSGKPVDVNQRAADWFYHVPDDLTGRIERLIGRMDSSDRFWRPIISRAFFDPSDSTIYPHSCVRDR